MNNIDILVTKSLRVFADNAKHNQNAKVEELGAIRHAQPLLCGIGALAMHLFARFHINNERFNFTPQFSDNTGEFGSRIWYKYSAFCGDDLITPMSYNSESSNSLFASSGTNIFYQTIGVG